MSLHQLQAHLTTILPHELRTPLSGILGASNFLRTDIDKLSREDVLELHFCIESSARRLARVVENFLLYLQLQIQLEEQTAIQTIEDNSNTTGELSISNPSEYIYEIATTCAEVYERTNDLHLEITDATVLCGGAHFHKAIYELIDNAMQFSSKGTPIEVRTQSNTEENSASKQPQYNVCITDHGRGMTNAQIVSIKDYPSVFKQFDRKMFEQQGIGMGLAVVHAIMELCHGSLHMTSNYGSSTTARLEFQTTTTA